MKNFQTEGEKLTAHNYDLGTFVNKTSYRLISTMPAGKTPFDIVFNGNTQSSVGCWYMRQPWLITEIPTEERGSTNSERAQSHYRHHLDKAVNATVSASHSLDFAATWDVGWVFDSRARKNQWYSETAMTTDKETPSSRLVVRGRKIQYFTLFCDG